MSVCSQPGFGVVVIQPNVAEHGRMSTGPKQPTPHRFRYSVLEEKLGRASCCLDRRGRWKRLGELVRLDERHDSVLGLAEASQAGTMAFHSKFTAHVYRCVISSESRPRRCMGGLYYR